MQRKTKLGLQTLRRAQAFLATRDLQVALGDLKPHVESLGAVIARLEQHAQEQERSGRAARETTDIKRALATALRREYLLPLSIVAARLFRDDPGVRSAFRLPARRDDEGLLHAARGIGERAGQHQARFVEAGLSPDFVERLAIATASFRDALVARDRETGQRSAATAGMLQEMARGRDLMRLLDIMLVPRLASQHHELAEWRTMARFIRLRSVSGLGDEGTPVSEGALPEDSSVTPLASHLPLPPAESVSRGAKAA